MDKLKLIQKLNDAISLELGAVLQYNQYAQVLLGEPRKIWRDFFEDSSNEAMKHARKFGERVVALGGIPSVEPQPVKQTNELQEMLENSLAVEQRAVQTYTEALSFCDDSPAYRNLLEEQIFDEQKDVEEIEMFLDRVQKVGAVPHSRRAGKAG